MFILVICCYPPTILYAVEFSIWKYRTQFSDLNVYLSVTELKKDPVNYMFHHEIIDCL